MTRMFWQSGIVDCGIGAWDVSSANTNMMLKDAYKFTGHRSLGEPKWRPAKIFAAEVPQELPRAGPQASTAFGAAAAAEMRPAERIARLLADLARRRSGTLSGPPPPQACAIL